MSMHRGSYVPGVRPSTLRSAGLNAHGVRVRPLEDLPEAEKPYEVPHAPIVLSLQSHGLEVLSSAIGDLMLSKDIGYRAITPEVVLVNADRAKQALAPRAARLIAKQGTAPQTQPPHDALLERTVNFVKSDVGVPLAAQTLPVFKGTRRTIVDNGQKAIELSLWAGNGDFIQRKQLPFVDATTAALETQLGLSLSGELPTGLRIPFGVIYTAYSETEAVANFIEEHKPGLLSVAGIQFGSTVA